MLSQLNKIDSDITIINEVPKKFFSEIERSITFGNHLFPKWVPKVFQNSDLLNKFKDVYDSYQRYSDPNKKKIRESFNNCIDVEKICIDDTFQEVHKLSKLPKRIQEPLEDLFNYLYNSAINQVGFKSHVKTNLRESIDDFLKSHKTQVCPFCGLESYINVQGQSRLSLDHWLPKDEFPQVAVNFSNLVPIGSDCNSRGAKGTKPIIFDKNNKRVVAFYPFQKHSGVDISFSFFKEPSIKGIQDQDWKINVLSEMHSENEMCESWKDIMNIESRYDSYLRDTVLEMWEHHYIKFIEKNENLIHANSVSDFKENLKEWEKTFIPNIVPGARLYRVFIEYLIYEATETYLTSLYQNFRSQAA